MQAGWLCRASAKQLQCPAVWIAVALCAIVFWLAIFFTFFQADEEALRTRLRSRKGKAPPLGVWTRTMEHPDGGYDEERFLRKGRHLLRQARRRSASGEIVSVVADERLRS